MPPQSASCARRSGNSTGRAADPDPARHNGIELDPVTVEARQRRELIDEQVSEFVLSIAGPGPVELLARWNVPVCVASAGLTAAEAEFVKGRIGRVASEAGIELGGPGCGPNFVVLVTPEREKLLMAWWSEEHRLFNRDRGLGGVNRFTQTDRAARVWHNARSAPPGIPGYAFSTSEHCGVGVTGSRLVHAAVRAIYSVIVAVDLARIEGKTFGQVADYVAMVGLAKIRPDPQLGDIPTILGLFDAGGTGRAKGLTAWDQSFLRAVYKTRDGSVTECPRSSCG
jgi:hypothetical protein